jgi:hypothetical protein
MMIESAERENARIASLKRVRIEDYDGDGFFLDGEYCADEFDLADQIRDKYDLGEEPGHVFSANKLSFGFYAEDMIENALSDLGVDMRVSDLCLDGKDLQRRLDEWISENPINWYEEGGLLVELSEEWLDEVRGNER